MGQRHGSRNDFIICQLYFQKLFGEIVKCDHDDDLEDHDTVDHKSKAFDQLKKIIFAPRTQKDLSKADYRGTSKCETKNSIDLLYAPKHTF